MKRERVLQAVYSLLQPVSSLLMMGLFLLSSVIHAQDERQERLSQQWVVDNGKPANLELTTQKDFTFLKNEVGNKPVVAFEEQTHEDEATFQLRGKVIDYFIEELGFEVVFFEARILDLLYANESVNRFKQIDSLRNSLFWFWKTANQHDHVLFFLQQQRQQGNTMERGGLDCNLTSSCGRIGSRYTKKLQAQIKAVDAQFLFANELISYLHFWDRIELDMKKGGIGSLSFKMNKREQSDFLEQSVFIQQWLRDKGQFEWAQIVNTIDEGIVLCTDFSIVRALFSKEWFLQINNGRDRLMAENLEFLLAAKNANKKVLLVGATYHFARNVQTITPSKLRGLRLGKSVTMGDIIHSLVHHEMYTIGFTAYQGTYGYGKNGGKGKSVEKESVKSLSCQRARQKYDAPFVLLSYMNDESEYWSNGAIIRFLDYATKTAAPHRSAVMDAVVYIKTVTPIIC